jgi:hypothetical protein
VTLQLLSDVLHLGHDDGVIHFLDLATRLLLTQLSSKLNKQCRRII